jgi:hypothetical protein
MRRRTFVPRLHVEMMLHAEMVLHFGVMLHSRVMHSSVMLLAAQRVQFEQNRVQFVLQPADALVELTHARQASTHAATAESATAEAASSKAATSSKALTAKTAAAARAPLAPRPIAVLRTALAASICFRTPRRGAVGF